LGDLLRDASPMIQSSDSASASVRPELAGGHSRLVSTETVPLALGLLGRKWTLSILGSVGRPKGASFTELLRAHPGLSHRVLWVRLVALVRQGYMMRQENLSSPRRSLYVLTEKGRHALQIQRLHSELIRRFGE